MSIMKSYRNTDTKNEFSQLRNRWKTVLTGGKDYDLQDEYILYRVQLLDEEAQNYWDTMEKSQNREFLWRDCADRTVSSHITASYRRIRAMAIAYSTRGSRVEGNKVLMQDMIHALDWMYCVRYNENCEQAFNWWDWEIGVPLTLNDIVVLLYDDLTQEQKSNYMNAIRKFTPDPIIMNNRKSRSTGANRIWKCIVTALRGMIEEEEAVLETAREEVNPVFLYTTEGDGFYEDGSFVQHRAHAYTGGYGIALLNELTNLQYLLAGSSWEITDPLSEHIYQWVYESFEPLLYKGAMMDMVRGREICRSAVEDIMAGIRVTSAIIRLSQYAPEQHATAYKEMIKAWIPSYVFKEFCANTSVHTIHLAEEILRNPDINHKGNLVGHYSFSCMDRVVHRKENFGLGLSMHSRRIAAYESINFENLRAWYTGYGMTYLYNEDLRQYSDGYWPTVDARRLPGTTVDTRTMEAKLELHASGGFSTQNWCGGAVMEGRYGVAGMELAPQNSTLTARKSWFMFDDEVVAVGSHIFARDGFSVETIVENRKITGDGDNVLTVEERIMPDSLGWSEEMQAINWIHLAGNVLGSDIGYYFPEKANIKGLREARTDCWYSINGSSGTKIPITRNYLTLWFDHGVNPSRESYAYVLLPNKSASQVKEYADNPQVYVVENSAEAHAIYAKKLNMIGVNFWEDKVYAVEGIQSNRKACIIKRQIGDKMEIAVSDPTQENTQTIEVEVGVNAKGVTSSDPNIEVLQISPIIKLKVHVNKTQGKTLKVSFEL